MPKLISPFIVAVLLCLPALGLAQASANPCEEIAPLFIDSTAAGIRRLGTVTTQIQRKLNTYNISSPAGESYRLCFNSLTPYVITQTLTFNVLTDKPLVIYGLNLQAGNSFTGPFISIGESAAQVTLQNIQVSGSKQGLVLSGDQQSLIDSRISGIPDGGTAIGVDLRATASEISNSQINGFDIQAILSGQASSLSKSQVFGGLQCVVIQGDGSKISGSEISNCSDVGVSIAAEQVLIGAGSADTYALDKNIIHNNGIGIFISQGKTNKFAYNSIYANKLANADSFVVDGGLQMLPDLLAQLGRPEIELTEIEGVKYGLQCSRNEDSQEITSQWIEVKNQSSGKLVLYRIDDESFQGKTYLLSCDIQEDGKCAVTFPLELQIPPSECGSDQLDVLAVLLHEDYSSIYTSSSFKLGNKTIATVPVIPETTTITFGPIAENQGGTTNGGDSGEDDTMIASNEPFTHGPGIDVGDEVVYNPETEEKNDEDAAALNQPSQTPSASVAVGGCALHSVTEQPSSALSNLVSFIFLNFILLYWKKRNSVL